MQQHVKRGLPRSPDQVRFLVSVVIDVLGQIKQSLRAVVSVKDTGQVALRYFLCAAAREAKEVIDDSEAGKVVFILRMPINSPMACVKRA
jgi:hypothetical protein